MKRQYLLLIAVVLLSTLTIPMGGAPPVITSGTYVSGYIDSLDVSMNNGSTTPVHVGDKVTIVVISMDAGIGYFEQERILIPIPSGLQFDSFVAPDITDQDYSPTTGIWYVQQQKPGGRGMIKTGIITCTVLPSAVGKYITIPIDSVRYATLMYEAINGTEYNVTAMRISQCPVEPKSAESIKVLPAVKKNSGNGKGKGKGKGKGDGNGDGNGNGNGDGNGNGNADSSSDINHVNVLTGSTPTSPQLKALANNLTSAENKDPLTSPNSGGGGGGGGSPKKVYEVTTLPAINASNFWPYLIAILAIIAVIGTGYYYGIKKDD